MAVEIIVGPVGKNHPDVVERPTELLTVCVPLGRRLRWFLSGHDEGADKEGDVINLAIAIAVKDVAPIGFFSLFFVKAASNAFFPSNVRKLTYSPSICFWHMILNSPVGGD
jgi:hypothetical protein